MQCYHPFFHCVIVIIPMITQATIGIDFLSKTMYLEDRTVSISLYLLFLLLVTEIFWSIENEVCCKGKCIAHGDLWTYQVVKYGCIICIFLCRKQKVSFKPNWSLMILLLLVLCQETFAITPRRSSPPIAFLINSSFLTSTPLCCIQSAKLVGHSVHCLPLFQFPSIDSVKQIFSRLPFLIKCYIDFKCYLLMSVVPAFIITSLCLILSVCNFFTDRQNQ